MKKHGWLAAFLLVMAPSMLFAGDASKKKEPADIPAKEENPAEGNCQVQLDLVVAQVSTSELRRTDPALFRQWAKLSADSGCPATLLGNGREYLEALQCLKEHKLVKVLSEPRLLTLSGRHASFLSGGQQAVPHVSGLGATEGVSFVPFGTRIEFLPIVQADQRIGLDLEVEVSSLQPEAGIEIQGVTVPGRKVQRVKTTLTVDDGQTVVFGGEQTCERTNLLLPILGDCLPTWLAWLFDQEVQEDLILLGTAHVVMPDGSAATSNAPKASDDLKWARKVATDFLELATSKSRAEAIGLLNPELARAMEAQPHAANVLDLLFFRDFHAPKIVSEEVSPNGSEVIFSGLLRGSDSIVSADADFILRVAKESEGGKWSVRLLRLEEAVLVEKLPSHDQLAKLFGKKVTLIGTAANAKGGPIVLMGEWPVYVEGLDCWPENMRDKKVRVTGKLVEKQLIPESYVNEHGVPSQGACGNQIVIEDGQWQVCE